MDNTNFLKGLRYDVNGLKEQRKQNNCNLDYLSWSNAWAEARKMFPDITYEIKTYHADDFGIMCYTTVTVDGVAYDMWLPVMDSSNKAMKSHPYEYTTKFGKKTVEGATMFDINKTYMRCLVKNIAVATGIGLYIYNGDDLPPKEDEDAPVDNPDRELPSINPDEPSVVEMLDMLKSLDATLIDKMLEAKKVKSVDELSEDFIRKCWTKKFMS